MKKINLLLSLLFLIFFTTGCIHQINKQGLILSLSESQLSNSFNESFPFKKDFVFGDLSLTNPNIKMYNSKNRLQASIDLGLKTVFTGAIRGSFSISGEPLFNKKTSSIHLQNVHLENFNFGRLKISDDFSNTFKNALQVMINEIFKKYPIYKIPKESIQGRFVKDIKIADSKLLVTYGI